MTNSNVLDNSYNYYTHTILMKVILISMIISKFLSNKWVITLLADRKSTAHIHTHYAQMHTRELKIINNLAFLDPKKREEFNVSAIDLFKMNQFCSFVDFFLHFTWIKAKPIYPIPCFPLNIVILHWREEGCIGNYAPRGPRDLPKHWFCTPRPERLPEGVFGSNKVKKRTKKDIW